MTDTPTLDRLLELPAEERLALAERLWNSLVADPASVPVPDWHRDIVAERLDEDDADRGSAENWTDVRARIERTS
jgi:putative addiction module component (TIGR02574 family)